MLPHEKSLQAECQKSPFCVLSGVRRLFVHFSVLSAVSTLSMCNCQRFHLFANLSSSPAKASFASTASPPFLISSSIIMACFSLDLKLKSRNCDAKCVLQSTRQRITIKVKGGDSMKDATVSARVEYDIKNEAEDILQKLGIPVSVVINSLYRQIIYRNGIPFSLTIPVEPKTIDSMTDAELNAKLEHSYKQSLRGEGRPYNEVFDELERSLL